MNDIVYDKPFLTFDEQIDHLDKKYGLIIQDRNHAKILLSSLSYYDLINGYKECFMIDGKYQSNIRIEDLYSFLDFDRNFQSILLKYSIYVENRFKNLLAYEIAKNYGVDMKDYLNKNNFYIPKDDFNRINNMLNNFNNIPKNEYLLNPTKHYLSKNHIPPWILFKNATFNDCIDLFLRLKKVDSESICDNLFRNFDKFDKIDKNYKKEFAKSSLIIVRKFRNKIAHNLKFITYRSGKDQLYLKNLSSIFGGTFIEKEDFLIKRGRNDPYAMILSILSLLNEDFLVIKFLVDLSRTIFVATSDQNSYGKEIFNKYCEVTNIPFNLNNRINRYIKNNYFK